MQIHFFRSVLRLVGIPIFIATASPPLAADDQQARKPNIIFILADDLGYGD